MKLKTTMTDAADGTRFAESRDGADIDHDAAAAHALMQAIREWWDRPPKDDSCSDASVTWIECRASELLREWGFDSGEVA